MINERYLNGYDEMLEQANEGRDFLCELDGDPEGYELNGEEKMNLDKIAREIVEYDFTGVDIDDTSEACYNLARDLYNATEEEADEIVNIIMDKYVGLIE